MLFSEVTSLFSNFVYRLLEGVIYMFVFFLHLNALC